MVNERTLANARTDVQRLDNLLRELHLEEQRCQLAKARLEAERTRVQTFVDMCDLAQRFDVPPAAESPAFTFETQPNGVKVVTVTPPKAKPTSTPSVRTTRKPKGTPTIARMIKAALKDAANRGQYELQPREITEFVRRKWWPNVGGTSISTVVWRMA